MTFIEWLKENDACDSGVAFAQGKTAREAWETCPHADWLLWMTRVADAIAAQGVEVTL